MVLNQQLKVNSFDHHLQFRVKNKKKLRRVLVAGLTLTSMVDMFSLLVIFLLQSFSNSPEVVNLQKGITLPSAVSTAAVVDAPVLAISADEVILDQKLMGTTLNLLKSPQTLLTELQNLRKVWQSSHPKEVFSGDVHLQADRGLSASLISQFMGILISQGYSSIHLAVVTGHSN